jgi:hypothetical protein
MERASKEGAVKLFSDLAVQEANVEFMRYFSYKGGIGADAIYVSRGFKLVAIA